MKLSSVFPFDYETPQKGGVNAAHVFVAMQVEGKTVWLCRFCAIQKTRWNGKAFCPREIGG